MKFKKIIISKVNNKKFVLCFILLVLALVTSICNFQIVSAGSSSTEEIENELNNVTQDVLSDIDFSDLDKIINDISFGNLFDGSIKDKVSEILNGDYYTNYSSLFSGFISIFLVDIREILPLLFTILAIGILSNLMTEFRESNHNASDIIHLVFLSILIIIILVVFKDVLSVTNSTFNLILKQIQIVFPILIALLSSIGSFSSVSIYNPLVAVLTTIVSVVFEKILYPLFIVIFVFTIIGSLTETVKLDKLSGFISSAFKWMIGIVFTLFSGFLTIQGITAGKFDNVSIKATKFAVKSYIPIIGSYISDGMDFLVLGSVLVKNSIGLVGILVLFVTIVSPIISMLVIKLGLQLCSGVLELSGSLKMSNFVGKCSKILIYPIVLILGIAFMYVITISLIICTANIF